LILAASCWAFRLKKAILLIEKGQMIEIEAIYVGRESIRRLFVVAKAFSL
jgi:hypothetical protein